MQKSAGQSKSGGSLKATAALTLSAYFGNKLSTYGTKWTFETRPG